MAAKDRRQRDPLRAARSVAKIGCAGAALMATLLTSLTAHFFMAKDGVGVLDYIVPVALFAVLLPMIMTVHHYGLEVLPSRPLRDRRRALPIFWAVALFIAGFSTLTSIPVIVEPAAYEAHNAKMLEGVETDADNTLNVYAQAAALDDPLENGEDTSSSLLRTEGLTGGVCLVGGGPGQCVSVLSSVLASTEAARQTLSDSERTARPILREIEATRAEIARIAASERLTQRDKLRAFEDAAATLLTAVEELRTVIPLSALDAALAGFDKRWDQLGISAAGAKRMEEEFSPYAELLAAELASIRDQLTEPLMVIEQPSPMELIGREFPNLFWMIMAIAALDIVPLAIIAMLLAAAPREDEDDDAPHSGGARGAADDEPEGPTVVATGRSQDRFGRTAG